MRREQLDFQKVFRAIHVLGGSKVGYYNFVVWYKKPYLDKFPILIRFRMNQSTGCFEYPYIVEYVDYQDKYLGAIQLYRPDLSEDEAEYFIGRLITFFLSMAKHGYIEYV